MRLIEQVHTAQRLPTPALARAIRCEAGVTQQQLADELGVHVVTVARWEAGTRVPRGTLRARYALLLNALHEAAHGAA